MIPKYLSNRENKINKINIPVSEIDKDNQKLTFFNRYGKIRKKGSVGITYQNV